MRLLSTEGKNIFAHSGAIPGPSFFREKLREGPIMEYIAEHLDTSRAENFG